MLLENALGVIKTDGVIIAEIKGWSDTDTATKKDISVQNNLNAAGQPVKRYKGTIPEQSLSLQIFFDPSDPGQAKIRRGAEGLEIENFPSGEGTGKHKITYSDCSVDSFNRNGQELDGFVGADVAVTVAGGMVDGTQ